MEVALATWAKLPGLSEDDQALVPALSSLGVVVSPAVWSDAGVEWGRFDAILLRSTWDYHRRVREFLGWVDRAGKSTALWNPPALVRWNSNKTYLRDLGRQGVPVVPTRFGRDVAEARQVLSEEGWDRAVVKPAVSAAGDRTFLVGPPERARPDAAAPWTDLLDAGELLVQPYRDEVERTGERSLVFLAGQYAHAFLRAPHLVPSTPLIEGAPLAASAEEVRVGRNAIEAAPGRPLYARVDLVTGPSGDPELMELELIEPFLGLRTSPDGASAFARAIVNALRGRPAADRPSPETGRGTSSGSPG